MDQKNSKKKVLLIENDPFQRTRLEGILKKVARKNGWEMKVDLAAGFSDAKTALDALFDIETCYDLILTDNHLGESNEGFALVELYGNYNRSSPFVLTSGQTAQEFYAYYCCTDKIVPYISKRSLPGDYAQKLENYLLEK